MIRRVRWNERTGFEKFECKDIEDFRKGGLPMKRLDLVIGHFRQIVQKRLYLSFLKVEF